MSSYVERGRRAFGGAESLAATRFAIDQKLSRWDNTRNGPRQFVTLDIGAGTFDINVLTAVIDGGSIAKWDVQSHFGVAIGGNELDSALLGRISEILRTVDAAGAALL